MIRHRHRHRLLGAGIALTVTVAFTAAACHTSSGSVGSPPATSKPTPMTSPSPRLDVGRPAPTRPGMLPGMPPVLNGADVYTADRAGMLSPVVRHDRPLIYVPNSESDTVSVINPRTYRVIATHRVGALPQHVTPSWDLKTLYVLNDAGNSVTTINPINGHFGRTIAVPDPYNMYFTPDGRFAIVVAERLGRLEFVDPHTMKVEHSLPVNCPGVDHADFSMNGRYAVFSCEFSHRLVKIDVARQRVLGYLNLPRRPGDDQPMPQDVKLSPDGKVLYVADMMSNGVWLINGATMKIVGFRHTGTGAHGLYVSRDSKYLYVTNRGEGSISLINLRTRKVARKWRIGGSPDMGGVSADGKVLWLSGRYNGDVYAISTRTGRLLAKIPVGSGPHGLCVFPQPGRYSLGHTGVFR